MSILRPISEHENLFIFLIRLCFNSAAAVLTSGNLRKLSQLGPARPHLLSRTSSHNGSHVTIKNSLLLLSLKVPDNI